MEEFIKSIPTVIPKLRGPIQLTGLVFTLICVFLINRVDTDNGQSLAIAGAIGVAVLTIPLCFHQSLLKSIPDSQRAWFLMAVLVVLLSSFGLLLNITYQAMTSTDPALSRFDIQIDPAKVQTFPMENGQARLQLELKFVPLSADPDQGATVFIGQIVIHDEQAITEAGLGSRTERTCAEVETCIGNHVFSELPRNPILVRAGSPGAVQTVTVNIKRVPKVMRIWGEFYQQESSRGGNCAFDNTVLGPEEGIPKLATYLAGKKISDICYGAVNQISLTGV